MSDYMSEDSDVDQYYSEEDEDMRSGRGKFFLILAARSSQEGSCLLRDMLSYRFYTELCR